MRTRLLGSLVIAAAVQFAPSGVAQPLVPTHVAVPYGADPAQRMDVYLAPSATPTPVLVEIHGGGWWQGKESQFQFYLHDSSGVGIVEKVVAKGISVVSIQYRLVDPFGASIVNAYPTPNLDVIRAIQFVRANAAAWNIDPDRVGAIGRSAGGHLGLWAALSNDFANPNAIDPVARESSRPIAMVSCWAPTDLAPPTGLLCTLNRLALCWYMGVLDPLQIGTVPVAMLQEASPTWLAANGVGPDKVREVPLLNLYHGTPIATSSSQLVTPTDDPHALVFSFLIKEALEAVGHDDVNLYHQDNLNNFQVEATDTAANFLDDRMRRPLPFITPDPASSYNPSSFAPNFRVDLGATSTSQFLADVNASPSNDNVFVIFASQTLFLPISLAQLQLFTSVSSAGNDLTIQMPPFPLSQVGVNPWLALVVIRNGKLYWSRRHY